MEKAYFEKYNIMQMTHETLPTYEHDYTENFGTQFRPFREPLHTTHISLTLNKNLTPIRMKTTHMIETNWSTKLLTTNLMINMNVTT